jgi:hypothetical protein
MQTHRESKFSSKRTGALRVDTPADGRSIALQSEIRKMGMKTISLPGKTSFRKFSPWLPARAQRSWLSVIGHWSFAAGAAGF